MNKFVSTESAGVWSDVMFAESMEAPTIIAPESSVTSCALWREFLVVDATIIVNSKI